MTAPVPDHAALPIEQIKKLLAQPVELTVPVVRTCNRHLDCDAAEAKFRDVDHCHDETCEDCFGS